MASLVAVLVLQVGPMINRDRQVLLTQGGAMLLIQALIPGRFSRLAGDRVVYLESVSGGHTKADKIFLAEPLNHKVPAKWRIVTAKRGEAHTKAGQEILVLHQGSTYEGRAGQKDYRMLSFERYAMHLPSLIVHQHNKISGLTTSQLWSFAKSDPQKAAELQWRLSFPLMTILLALLAIPLSKVAPRQGKYTRLLPAMLIFIVYANLLFILRGWIATGKFSIHWGLWPAHAMLAVVVACLFVQPGFWKRLRGRFR